MSVAAVDRAFQLLRAVPNSDGTLSELARVTGFPIGTVSRLMTALEAAGAVEREDKAYRIGPTITELGTGQAAAYDLVSIATARLVELAAETNETAGVAEAVGTDLVHLGQVATQHDVSVQDWTGFRVGSHSGCIGFVMMAHWSHGQIDDYLAQDLEQYVNQTVIDPAAIRARLASIRVDGFLWTTDEYAQGVTTIAAPLRDRSGAAVGALHVHGPSFRFPDPDRTDPDRTVKIETSLKHHASAISAVLGWKEDA